MGALAQAAIKVSNSHCKGSMRLAEQAREAGDTHCAAGALFSSLLPQNTLLSLDGETIGPDKDMLKYDVLSYKYNKIWEEYQALRETFSEEESRAEFYNWYWSEPETITNDKAKGLIVEMVRLSKKMEKIAKRFEDASNYFKGKAEFKVLAGVITDNYPERVEGTNKDYPINVIIAFNDHNDTTSDEVVAMMEKADLVMQDRAIAEDAELEALVAEVDELVSA